MLLLIILHQFNKSDILFIHLYQFNINDITICIYISYIIDAFTILFNITCLFDTNILHHYKNDTNKTYVITYYFNINLIKMMLFYLDF